MKEEEVKKIVADVVSQLARGPAMTAPAADIPVEASARHVHLTAAAVEALFGKQARLTAKRALSQPGEFLCNQRVKLVTAKGQIENVAVLGPERPAVQVELSFTDARQLGIDPPLNLSGDLTGAADVLLVGEKGVWKADGAVIVAQNHIHMTPADAARYAVADGQRVDVQVAAKRRVVFQGVTVRVKDSFALAMHLDFDEANACGLGGCGTKGALLGCATTASAAPVCGCATPAPATQPVALRGRVVTEAVAKELATAAKGSLTLPAGTIVTPSARDIFSQQGIRLEMEGKGTQR